MAENLNLNINLDSKQAQKGINDLTKSVDDFGKTAKNNFKGSSQAFNVFKGSVASAAFLKGIDAITGAFKELFDTFIVDGVAAAQVQEDAINKLNVALNLSGNYTKKASEDFQEFASSLQQVTKFGDEVILQNAALIASLGSLSGDSLKGATQSALDLAAGLGIDLATAANLVGRAATGNVALFSRYGVVIKKGADNAQTFANALESINSKFGGAAAGQVFTFSGAVQQTTNTFGDLQEEIGFTITKNEAVISTIKVLNDVFSDLGKSVNGNRGELSSFVTEGVDSAISAFKFLVDTVDVLARAFDVGFNTITAAGRTFALGIVTPLAAVEQAIATLISAIPTLEEKFGAGSDSISKIAESLAADVQRDLAEIEGAFTETTYLDEFSNRISETQEKIRQETGKTAEFLKNNNAQQIEDEKQKNSILNAIKEEERLKAEEQALALKAASDEATASDIAKLESNLAEQSAIRQKYADKDKEIVKTIKKTREAESKKAADAEKKSLKSLVDFETNTQQGRAANFKSSLATISSLQSQSNSTLFNVGKAAAIGTATIDGIAAVQKALASAPPPFNYAIAAAVGVATAANVAKIASQKPPQFADGGIVEGNKFQGDRQIASVDAGELILNQAQQDSIANQIGGQSMVLQLVDGAGRLIAETVRDEQERGFKLLPVS